MSLSLACPACGKVYNLSETLAGKKARCKKCAIVFRIPSLEPEVEILDSDVEIETQPEPEPPPVRRRKRSSTSTPDVWGDIEEPLPVLPPRPPAAEPEAAPKKKKKRKKKRRRGTNYFYNPPDDAGSPWPAVALFVAMAGGLWWWCLNKNLSTEDEYIRLTGVLQSSDEKVTINRYNTSRSVNLYFKSNPIHFVVSSNLYPSNFERRDFLDCIHPGATLTITVLKDQLNNPHHAPLAGDDNIVYVYGIENEVETFLALKKSMAWERVNLILGYIVAVGLTGFTLRLTYEIVQTPRD